MSDYAEVRLSILASEVSDMTPAFLRGPPVTCEYTPDTALYRRIVVPVAPGVDLGVAAVTTVSLIAIHNSDQTNYVTATFFSVGNGGNGNGIRIQPGKLLVFGDISAATDVTLTANSAACPCNVWVFGTA